MFFALETLNKSYVSLNNLENTDSFDELTKLSLFLQKAIEYYKVYKNYMITEKIKKLAKNENFIENNENFIAKNENQSKNDEKQAKNDEKQAKNEEKQENQGKTTGKNEENEKNDLKTIKIKKNGKIIKPIQKSSKIERNDENPEKLFKVESKVKQFIEKNGVNEKKIDDLAKMKKEIQEIKDQNSKLHWEIERDVY